MYYIIKEETLNKHKPTFLTGGLGIDYKNPSEVGRFITNDVEKALVFDTVENAKQYLTRDFVVAIKKHNGYQKV